MRHHTHLSFLQKSAAIVAAFLFVASSASAQVSGGTDTNSAKMADYQNECAISKNPSNRLQLFAACNNANGGLFGARSTDGGATWVYPDPSKTIANGVNPALGPAACCDPTLAWDTFGNLFITYIDAGVTNIVTILSTDGGATFTNLASFGPASVDQPTVAVGAGSVWIVWNQSGSMVARGAAVTGLGPGGVGAFGPVQAIPGTGGCSFGDLAIAPSGAVVQACESPSGGSGPAQI
ncbi:MAG: glycoside hydrolase, partial [Acidobacteriota bacterium]|nr:glycoside hydrolase [Acidobacteriota bacterium]